MEPVGQNARDRRFTIPRLSGMATAAGRVPCRSELATTAGPRWMPVHEILLAESGDRVDRAFEQPDLDGPLDHLAA